MVALLHQRTNNNPQVPTMAFSFRTSEIDHQAQRTLQDIVARQILVTSVGFGGAPCNQLGISMYQMILPAAGIYNGDPQGTPATHALGFSLDLFDTQIRA